MNYLSEYKNFVRSLEAAEFEMYICGIGKEELLNNKLIRSNKWIMEIHSQGHVLFCS